VAEIAKLPPSLRAQAEPWQRQVEARIAALDAARRICADALAALAPAGSQGGASR